MKEFTLVECPPGLFVFRGTLCFKSEYRTEWGSSPDAYVVSSGEYFWGGESDRKRRDALPVQSISEEELRACTDSLPPDVKFHMTSFDGPINEPISEKKVDRWWPDEMVCKACGHVFQIDSEPDYLVECCDCGSMIIVEPPSTLDLAREKEK